MVVGAALVTSWIVQPGTEEETRETRLTHWNKWQGPHFACSKDVPLDGARRVGIELTNVAGKQLSALRVSTNDEGVYEGPGLATARRASMYCGPLKARFKDADGASSPADTPEKPSVVAFRHAKPFTVDVPMETTKRTTIAHVRTFRSSARGNSAFRIRPRCGGMPKKRRSVPHVERHVDVT